MDNEEYIPVMQQSLKNKVSVLNDILSLCTEQEEMFKKDRSSVDEEMLESVRKKGNLIDELKRLDEGFDSLYNKVAGLLEADRKSHAQEILDMQALIREITDLSVRIQAQEKRNKDLADRFFDQSKERIGSKRSAIKAANIYRKNMKKIQYVDPQFMDRKK